MADRDGWLNDACASEAARCEYCLAESASPERTPPDGELDPGLLAHLYHCLRLSTYRIAARTGIDRQRVTRALRRAGVPLRPRGVGRLRPVRDPGGRPCPPWLLRELYEEARLNSRQIAAIVGMPERTVRDRLHRAGVSVRTRGGWNREDRVTVPADVLRVLYVELGMTAAEVGQRLGLSGNTVLRSAHALGVPVRSGGAVPLSGPDEIELVSALYADTLIAGVLAAHDIPRVPPGGSLSQRFREPLPLTTPLVKDLYWGCGVGLNHIELLTGQASGTVRKFMQHAGIPLRPAGGRSPFMRRWRTGLGDGVAERMDLPARPRHVVWNQNAMQQDERENIMTSFDVTELSALEILDSRGRPTLAVTVTLSDGTTARAGVPSGASTGSREAVELRDGDKSRYAGLGVLTAAANVNGEICDLLRGRSWTSLAEADQAVIDLDGTPNKARLGANATVGVSMALARALAVSAKTPLWRWLAPEGVTPSLPVPHFNVVNGGVHAPNDLDFQEFMIAPLGAPSMADAVRAGAGVYAALRRELGSRKLSTGLGDEGGFAPEITEPEEVLRLLVAAIGDAGYIPGGDGVSIALDPAASEFRQPDGRYRVAGELLDSAALVDRLAAIVQEFPVHLIEDGLGEDDGTGWVALTRRLGATIELVGDDIFCTNPAIITGAIERGIANSSLIKLNQIGTVTETLEAMAICRRAGYRQFVSHRSGETEDSFIADLAVGTGCGHLKSGAPARGERTAKYNRLIEIAATAPALRYGMR